MLQVVPRPVAPARAAPAQVAPEPAAPAAAAPAATAAAGMLEADVDGAHQLQQRAQVRSWPCDHAPRSCLLMNVLSTLRCTS